MLQKLLILGLKLQIPKPIAVKFEVSFEVAIFHLHRPDHSRRGGTRSQEKLRLSKLCIPLFVQVAF